MRHEWAAAHSYLMPHTPCLRSYSLRPTPRRLVVLT